MNNKLGGPRTEQGKARSSQNATRHGLRSNKLLVLQNENPEAWQEMLDACVEEFQPVNEFEQRLVEEIASAKWRLRRAWTVETALWDREMDEQHEEFSRSYRMSDEGTRQALAFKALAEKGKALSLIGRYESRLKRDYRNAIKALEERRQNRVREAADADVSRTEATQDTQTKVAKEKLPNELPEPHTPTEPKPAPVSGANSASSANVPNELQGLSAPDEPIVH